jgi:tripartite-type tricarboxylate transporter receptor subunit TctC
MKISAAIVGFAASLAMLSGSADAQYAARPIRLVVPFPPGGATDLAARVFAQPLSQALGQSIVIDNKAGADGAIAALDVMRAPPDGYTLFFATNTALCGVPALRKAPPYDPIADFTPLSLLGRYGFFLFVHPGVPASNVADLLAHIRANPGKLNYGTGTSTAVVASAQLKLQERLDVLQIPYKGDAPLTVDLVAGRVQFAFMTPGTAMQQAREGRLRVVATLLPQRSPLAAEVPTMAESGVPRLSIVPWAGLFGPAKMPRAVVERLARETKEILTRPEVRESLGRYAIEGQSSSPEELAAFLRAQVEAWRRTVREVGIEPE